MIELLIVIVVLGILAAVVIFALGGITRKSALASCQADGATVSVGISAFNAQNTGTTVTQGELTGNTLGGPYVQSWPSNLPHYAYAISDGTATFAIPSTVTGTVSTATVTSLYPLGTVDYPAGTLLVATGDSAAYTPGSSSWVYTAISGSNGNIGGTGITAGTAATAPWLPYEGPTTCANVS